MSLAWMHREIARYETMPECPRSGKKGMDPTYWPNNEYRGPTLLAWLRSGRASEDMVQYCRACVRWHKDPDNSHERPPWLLKLVQMMEAK